MSHIHLTVINAFGPYRAGQKIEDANKVSTILSSRARANVVQTVAEVKKADVAEPSSVPEPAKPADTSDKAADKKA